MDRDKKPSPVRGVCMLINTFYPLPPGGAERQAELLSAYLSQHNIKVTVITRHVSPFPRHEERDGYSIIRIPQYGPGKIKTLTFTIGAIIAILSRRHSFDILHAHLIHSPAFAAVVAGKLIGKKTIVKFGSSGTGSHLEEAKTSLRVFVRMAVLKYWGDFYIVLADEMQNELISEGYDPGRILHMFNGVDTKYFVPPVNKQKARETLGKGPGFFLVYTGRLHPSKNIPSLLHALKKAHNRLPDIHLLLVGDGEERASLIDLTSELNLETRVDFVGKVSNVIDYLQAADLFVLPSFSEGNSNSLLEAMSCGLTCISTRVGAAVDVLENGVCGVLVNVDDVEQLTEAIVRLASNTSECERYGNLARQRVVEHYSIATIGREYMALYNKILDNTTI